MKATTIGMTAPARFHPVFRVRFGMAQWREDGNVASPRSIHADALRSRDPFRKMVLGVGRLAAGTRRKRMVYRVNRDLGCVEPSYR
jgi:hypothetical protein